jgi:tetratricopeptide (TPR) repeat protein
MTAEKQRDSSVPHKDNDQLAYTLERRHEIAEELHKSTSRAQAERALAELTAIDEANQMALLKALARQHDTDAADILLAINELTPNKAIRKEARRSLIHLAGAKVYPSWTPEPEAAPAITVINPPRFWKGYVTEKREEGEIEVVLCWEQGFEFGEARLMAFLLDFWKEGVKNFTTEVGSKRHIDALINTSNANYSKSSSRKISITDCTLAEGRRLIQEALSVNSWRGTAPSKEYRNHLPTIQQLVMKAPEVDLDRGRTFINPEMDADEVVGNFIGAWSLGDYGLCFDLLASDSPLLEGLARDEWINQRRKWADEAPPARFEMSFLRERERSQQSLWLPNSVLSDRISTQKEIEVGWSLELTDTPLSGTLLEMPMATATYKETGQRWFWTSYLLVQEERVWRIRRMTDEGAKAQGFPIAELQQLLQTHDDRIREIVETHSTTEKGAAQYYDEIIWRTIQSLHYDDALLVKLPLDRTIYDDAFRRAQGLQLSDRAIVYLQGIIQHFPKAYDIRDILQYLAIAYADLSERYEQLDMHDRSKHFYEEAIESVRKSIAINNTAQEHIILAQLLMMKNQAEEAIAELQLAKSLISNTIEEAQIEADLGNIAMIQQEFDEAIAHFKRVSEINPNYKGIWLNIGLAYRRQENYDQAEVYYQRALEAQPDDLAAYVELGTLYLATNHVEDALETIEKGLRYHPNSAHLHALLAAIYAEKGDRRQAQAALAEAERINPDLEIVQAVRELVHKKRK